MIRVLQSGTAPLPSRSYRLGSGTRRMVMRSTAPGSIRVHERPESSILVSEIISALSYALDLTEGQPMGHSVRSCMIGMRLAQNIGLSMEEQADLYYALLLKDAGCSSNSSRLFHILNADEIRAKRDVKTTDWTKVGFESLNFALTHVASESPLPQRMWKLLQVAATQQADSRDLVKIRCERGSYIAKKLGFSDAVAEGIHSLDEHWNGGGYPNHLLGEEIPMFSRIANLCQTLEVFYEARGEEDALDAVQSRSGRWFDPELVAATMSLSKQGILWLGLDSKDLLENVLVMEPEDRRLIANDTTIDSICLAFADIIDAK